MKTKLRKPKSIWLVYQYGICDFIGPTLREAKEMAICPSGSRQNFRIERWNLVRGKYQFSKLVQG